MKTDSAIKITQTFNGRVEFVIAGSYFKLLAAPLAVDVELWRGGRKVLDAEEADAGFYQRAEFDKVVVTNPSSQAISLLIAGDEGGSDQFTGSFTINGPLHADNGDGQAAKGASGLVGVASRLFGYNGSTFDRLRADSVGGAGALRMTERGYVVGSSLIDTTNRAANTAVNHVAPAANTNGLILWRAGVRSQNTGGYQVALLAKASAPATIGDGDVLLGLLVVGGAFAASRERPCFVAAGKGIYTFNNAAEAARCVDLEYTLL